MRRKTREKKTVLEMDSSLPDPTRKNARSIPSNDEAERKGHKGAARRAGVPVTSDGAAEPLPFQATLAFAFRGAGGKATAVEYARLAAPIDERFLRFIVAYDKLSESDKKEVRLEDLCKVAEILPHEFLGGIAAIAHKYNVDVGNLIAAIHHPDIVQATVDSAKSPFGQDDRRMLHTHVGFLPQGKGQTINVPVQVNNPPAQGQVSQGASVSQLPRFESSTRDLAQIVRGDEAVGITGARQIAAPVEVIDAEEV